MKKDDLIPLKRVLAEIGVSRATLWRASRSGIEGFPAPTIVHGRLYWKKLELPRIENALDEYQGRGAFDRRRQRDRDLAERRQQEILKASKGKSDRRRQKKRKQPEAKQGDFFAVEGSDAKL